MRLSGNIEIKQDSGCRWMNLDILFDCLVDVHTHLDITPNLENTHEHCLKFLLKKKDLDAVWICVDAALPSRAPLVNVVHCIRLHLEIFPV